MTQEKKPETVSTPLGITINVDQIPALSKAAGLIWENDHWLIIAKPVKYLKETDGRSKSVEVEIPIRMYNFEYYYLTSGSFDEAVKKTDETYLPSKLGFSSYATLLADARGKADARAFSTQKAAESIAEEMGELVPWDRI